MEDEADPQAEPGMIVCKVVPDPDRVTWHETTDEEIANLPDFSEWRYPDVDVVADPVTLRIDLGSGRMTIYP